MAVANPTLEAIRIKVRRLTRKPTENQISTADIDQYINTFIEYDFPSELRLFPMKTNFIFYTKPFIDTYSVNTIDTSDPLYNFYNLYITTEQPVYIAGYVSLFDQDQYHFYGIYPKINFIQSIGIAGDGVTTSFTGVINTQQNTPGNPTSSVANVQTNILQNSVLFDSIATDGSSILVIDYPATSLIGYLGIPNTPATSISNYGQINYITGAFTVSFPVAPAIGVQINSQTVIYQPTRPQAMLYYDSKFVFRPVPDQAYKVEMEAYLRPIALLQAGQSPQLEQWWQLIAYGAAKKIFEDLMDTDSVQMIMPEFDKQMRLALRTTLVQRTKQRTATIYTEQQNQGNSGNGFGYGGGQF